MKKADALKLPKGVDQTFVDDIQGLSIEALQERVYQLQVSNAENEAFKESREFEAAQAEYDYAKERYNLVAGPVRDVTVAIKNKTKLLIERLKERGAV